MQSKNGMFFQMIEEVLANGIRARIYDLRSKLLFSHGTKHYNKLTDVVQIVCSMDVATYAETLMKELPSIIETKTCLKGCQQKNILGRIQIPDYLIKDKTANESLASLFSNQSTNCNKPNCDSLITKRDYDLGKKINT